MQKITPFLWFDTQAEEAAKFYISIFRNSKITGTTRYGEAGPGPKGPAMTVAFNLDGQDFVARNGGPQVKVTAAGSFAANCETPEEVDAPGVQLSRGGQRSRCGWPADKFRLPWPGGPT